MVNTAIQEDANAIALTSYQGDNMSFFGKGEMISTGIKLRDLFLEKFKANPEIVAPKDVRLLFKNKKNKTDG